MFNILHSKAASRAHQLAQGADRPQLEAPTVEPILPKLIEAQRLIVAGGSDSGKSTLAKHIMAARADHSQIIVIDPHAPSKILGYDVIGAGRDYEAIGAALESLVWIMTSRYTDVAQGFMGYGDHNRVSVFIDEWTSIQRKVDRAGEFFETLLTESRKVNMHLTLLTHSPNVDTLGISAAIRKSAMIVELVGGQGNPHRAFIHPNTKLAPDGSKAGPVEYALPGPFAGFAKPAGQVVLELPDARALKALAMSEAGESLTAIAREFYGVDNPNGRHLKEIKNLIKRAEQAAKAAT
jgi:energy-coupling factor transporter ATP-binding protein EcfA2